jgi:hypothetical protein
MDDVVDVSEMNVLSSFRAEVCGLVSFRVMHHCVLKRKGDVGGRVGTGVSSQSVGTADQERCVKVKM